MTTTARALKKLWYTLAVAWICLAAVGMYLIVFEQAAVDIPLIVFEKILP